MDHELTVVFASLTKAPHAVVADVTTTCARGCEIRVCDRRWRYVAVWVVVSSCRRECVGHVVWVWRDILR